MYVVVGGGTAHADVSQPLRMLPVDLKRLSDIAGFTILLETAPCVVRDEGGSLLALFLCE